VVTAASTWRNPEFYLAHFELKDSTRTLGLLKTVGPSGLPSLLDTFVRLSKSPIVSIAKIRGRARGATLRKRLNGAAAFEEFEKAIKDLQPTRRASLDTGQLLANIFIK
jgi:hypothetical protein